MTDKTFDLRRELLALHDRLGGWRQVAKVLGEYSAGYWSGIVTGTIRPSRKAENCLRRRLGMAPKGVKRIVEMPPGDLAWYLAHRQPIGGPPCEIFAPSG